jgi:hypothetical protein
MSTLGFSLIPADDPSSTAADDLAAATTGALALPAGVQAITPDAPEPFGITWAFDWDHGQFIRVGTSPAQVADFDALGEWCLMAIHSARYAHPVFSDVFGMEEPDNVIGEFAVGEALADWQKNIVEALMVHDRITSVENLNLDWDPTTGILLILQMDIVTDEDETLTVSDVTLQAGQA